MKVDYNILHETETLLNIINKRFHLSIESLRVKTNTKFLEHVMDINNEPTSMLIASQNDNLIISNDFGTNWDEVELGFSVGKCYTTHRGFHLLYCTDEKLVKLYSPDWRQLKVFNKFKHPWHGTWSIDQSSSGTLIWCEYAYSDDVLYVHRSTMDGLDWEIVFSETGGGDDKPSEGRIRHFHTCQKDPYLQDVWYLSSGDTQEQCRMWKSIDDGLNWSEVKFNSDGISGFSDDRQISRKLWRRTAEYISRDSILYPTDDHLFQTGAKLVSLKKSALGSPRIIADLGPNEMRNFINIGDGWNLAISESKNNRTAFFVYLCHQSHGAVQVACIPNEKNLKSNVCNSISSRRAKDGVFWSFHDGTAIRGRPKILKWTAKFTDILQEKDIIFNDKESPDLANKIESPPGYPKSIDIKVLKRDGLPFIDPQKPEGRNQSIDKIFDDARNKNLLLEEAYDHRLGYLNFHRSTILNNKVVSFDEDNGIPINKYVHIEESLPYPVTIGLFALEQITKFRKFGKVEFLEAFNKACEWILNNHDGDGNWRVPFQYEFFKGRSGGVMAEGWISALGQGYCLSALSRYYLHCRSKKESEEKLNEIKNVLEKGLVSFELDVSDGGLKRLFLGKYAYYEEYPSPLPSLVLNGFMFSLLGLYDVWKTIGDSKAKSLYENGLKTLQIALPFYDLGDRSAYDLTHLQEGNENYCPNPAREGYHQTHVRLLDAFNSIENGIFEDVMVRWIQYSYGVISPNN